MSAPPRSLTTTFAEPTPNRLRQRAMIALGATLAVYTVSVAPHEGEFWPFSIFPMFSQAGKPWTRALVVDVTDAADGFGWGPWELEQLPGPPRSSRSMDFSTNDLSKFVQLTETWTDERQAALRRFLRPALDDGRRLLLLKVTGRSTPSGPEVLFTGLVRVDARELHLNPKLGAER